MSREISQKKKGGGTLLYFNEACGNHALSTPGEVLDLPGYNFGVKLFGIVVNSPRHKDKENDDCETKCSLPEQSFEV